MKRARVFTLGFLLTIAGAAIAQSFTEYLNVRIFEDLEVQQDASVTGSVTANTVNTDGLSIGAGQTISNSDNIPLLDASNAFTAYRPIDVTHASLAEIRWLASDAGTHEKQWVLTGRDSGQFAIQTRDDGASLGETAIQITRSGMAIGAVQIQNGDLDVTDGLSVGGGKTISDSDNVCLTDGTDCPAAADTDTDTFSLTFTDGCDPDVTRSFRYWRTGNIVTIRSTQSGTCAADGSSTFFRTDTSALPSAITPSFDFVHAGSVGIMDDNGADVEAGVRIESSGRLAFCKHGTSAPCTTNTWDTSGSRSLGLGWSVTYALGF